MYADGNKSSNASSVRPFDGVATNHEYGFDAFVAQALAQDALPHHPCSPEENHLHDSSMTPLMPIASFYHKRPILACTEPALICRCPLHPLQFASNTPPLLSSES